MAVLDLVFTTNDAVRAYLFYSSLLVLKMMAMGALTGRTRFAKKAFANPEDTTLHNVKVKTDESVERIRRAHLNDLENITAFLAAGLIYLFTNPAEELAINLFRVFTAARFAHTFVYAIYVIPQPARALSWVTGYLVTGYMAISSVLYFL